MKMLENRTRVLTFLSNKVIITQKEVKNEKHI